MSNPSNTSNESKFKFTEKMREISGFGGEYEQACRDMICAGAKWIEENPTAKLSFGQYQGVTGLTTGESPDMIILQDVMNKACGDGGCSGAMMHACSNHSMFIKTKGWDEYVKEMEKEIEKEA